jgi:hypothetical protein
MKKQFQLFVTLFIIFFTFAFSQKIQAAPSDYLDTVQRIYIGYYQRPADPSGLLYWADRLDNVEGNLNEIIDAFATSEESLSLYGQINNSTIGTVIDKIYTALFQRTADAGGKLYYSSAYAAGQFPDGRRCTEGTIVLDILGGAQNQDLFSINNKLLAANLFTRTLDPDLDGRNLQYTYAGDSDAIAGRQFLAQYATSVRVASQAETTAYIQGTIANPGEPPAVITLKTSTIQQYAPGMNWSYTLTGTLTNENGAFPITGTMAAQILPTTKQSPVTLEQCLDRYTSMTFTVNGQTISSDDHDYSLQSTDGSILNYGMTTDSGDAWVVSPANGFYLEVMSPVALGQSFGASVIFSDGSALTYAYTIDDVEEVSTGIGIYQAYRVTISETKDYPTGNISRYIAKVTSWVVPGLGELKEIGTATYYSGGNIAAILSFTAVLFSTNVNY